MKRQIRFGNSVLSYNVVKTKRRKTSEIRVDENGVEVRAPLLKNDSEIKKMLENKKRWIFKKQLEFSDLHNKGTKFKSHTTKYLEKRVWGLASKTGLIPSKVVIKELKNRWGSCTKGGVINLNSALAKAPTQVIDYIIIHELCHLRIRDHSRKYWNLLSKFMPNYEFHKRWLDFNGKIIL
jgi:predicted metal-dependent hydrolase